MRAFWQNWTWKIAPLFLPVNVRHLGGRIFDLTMFSNCLAVGKTSFTNYWRCACFGNIMLQKSVRKKFKGEMWFLWLNLFLFQNALRHVKCVRRNPRNHLYKKLSNERSLKLKKRIVFLVWFARLWKSSLVNKSYCGLRGVNHFAAKTVFSWKA